MTADHLTAAALHMWQQQCVHPPLNTAPKFPQVGFSRRNWRDVCAHLFLLSTAKMAPKTKSKKSAAANPAHRRRELSSLLRKDNKCMVSPLTPQGGRVLESKHSLNAVMDLLVDMSSRLSANEQVVDQLRADKAYGAGRKPQTTAPIPSPCHP